MRGVLDTIICPKCSDKNLKAKEIDRTSRDCFGYNDGSELDDSFLKGK